MAKMRKIEPKVDDFGGCCPEDSSDKKKEKKIYPRLTLRHEFFPETSKWEVGKEYEIKLVLKMDELSVSRFQNESGFEIHGIEVFTKEKKKETKEE